VQWCLQRGIARKVDVGTVGDKQLGGSFLSMEDCITQNRPWVIGGVSLPKTPSMNSFLFYISEKLSCAPVLMVKTTDMRNCHDLSLFWRFN
jgi:hypothetical protein